MRRREFITLLGGAVAAWPLIARGQQPAMPVVGFLRSASLADSKHLVTAFIQGLKDAGFVEGQNVAIEYRYADNQMDRLADFATELIRRPVAVIVANNDAALVAKVATTTVPIVFQTGGDPVGEGLVPSLNRPGGNITGVVFFTSVLGAKRLEMLRQVAAKPASIGLLVNSNSPTTKTERNDVQAAAEAIGQKLIVVEVNREPDIEPAFAKIAQAGAGALVVGSGAFLNSHRERLVTLAARHALPASYVWREAAAAGGLMSYGPSITDAFRQSGVYAGRILKGEKAGDLPVIRSTKFELVINLKTAKALGLDVPPTLLAIADEVIE